MIRWMLYSALVALMVAAAARAAEWLARLVGYRVRWIWAGALALTVFLSVFAALRGTGRVGLPTASAAIVDLTEGAHGQLDASWRRTVRMRIEHLRHSLDAPLLSAVASVHRAVPPAANGYAAWLSSVISLAFVAVFVAVGRRFRTARRQWPLVTMHGVDVRVAPRVGPVVLGFVRPEIVVPRWLLARPADEQRLVVTHEYEHVHAGDPLLLGLAWAAVVVAPWNLAVWYMLSRLRLAVELDCDTRVLRRGAAPRSYGSLLIDVAQHASDLRLSALALADNSTHLHQRILAMNPSVPRFARVRGGLAATFALAGVLVACQATLPTDAEIEQMDVAAATRAARELAKARHADTTVAYTVNGSAATTAEVSALAPGAVGKVQIVTGKDKLTQINIETLKKLALSKAAGDSGRKRRTALMQDGTAGRVDTVSWLSPMPNTKKALFTGLIFIDGARATESEMKSLDRTQIESVEVLKGPYAALFYSDPEAGKGVIAIKTKRGGTK